MPQIPLQMYALQQAVIHGSGCNVQTLVPAPTQTCAVKCVTRDLKSPGKWCHVIGWVFPDSSYVCSALCSGSVGANYAILVPHFGYLCWRKTRACISYRQHRGAVNKLNCSRELHWHVHWDWHILLNMDSSSTCMQLWVI